jgi:hypothetical protein
MALLSCGPMGCGPLASPSLNDLEQVLVKAEFQPDPDGWAAARRRRLLRQYFLGLGRTIITESEPLKRMHPADKYRSTHLLVSARRVHGPSPQLRSITYALIAPTGASALEQQRECDARLFKELRAVTQPQHDGVTLRLSMDRECRNAGAFDY